MKKKQKWEIKVVREKGEFSDGIKYVDVWLRDVKPGDGRICPNCGMRWQYGTVVVYVTEDGEKLEWCTRCAEDEGQIKIIKR